MIRALFLLSAYIPQAFSAAAAATLEQEAVVLKNREEYRARTLQQDSIAALKLTPDQQAIAQKCISESLAKTDSNFDNLAPAPPAVQKFIRSLLNKYHLSHPLYVECGNSKNGLSASYMSIRENELDFGRRLTLDVTKPKIMLPFLLLYYDAAQKIRKDRIHDAFEVLSKTDDSLYICAGLDLLFRGQEDTKTENLHTFFNCLDNKDILSAAKYGLDVLESHIKAKNLSLANLLQEYEGQKPCIGDEEDSLIKRINTHFPGYALRNEIYMPELEASSARVEKPPVKKKSCVIS